MSDNEVPVGYKSFAMDDFGGNNALNESIARPVDISFAQELEKAE